MTTIHRGLTLIAAIVGSTFLLPADSLPQAATATTQSTTQIAQSFDNPCTGEVVTVIGEVHTVFHVSTDANGGMHVLIRANSQGVSGVSESGTRYRVQNNFMVHTNAFGPAPVTSTAVQTLNLIGKGSGDNFLLHVTAHFTINANDETSVDLSIEREACQGNP